MGEGVKKKGPFFDPLKRRELDRFPAEGTESESLCHRIPAIRAIQLGLTLRRLIQRLPRFTRQSATTSTIQKGLPPFYADDWQKEDRKIVVRSLQNSLKEPAGRAHSGMAIKCRGLRLDSGDEEEHDLIWTPLHVRIERTLCPIFNHISFQSGKVNVNQVYMESLSGSGTSLTSTETMV